jgi:hypothetical protein
MHKNSLFYWTLGSHFKALILKALQRPLRCVLIAVESGDDLRADTICDTATGSHRLPHCLP